MEHVATGPANKPKHATALPGTCLHCLCVCSLFGDPVQHDKVMSGGSADGAAAAGWAAAKGGRKGKKGSGGKKGKKAAAGADAAAGDDAAGTAEAVADPELLKRQQQLKVRRMGVLVTA